MKLHKMIEMCLKYDNMHTIGTINAFICINNHVNLCIKCMLSTLSSKSRSTLLIHSCNLMPLVAPHHLHRRKTNIVADGEK